MSDHHETMEAACPRWNKCHAPLCPLLEWRRNYHSGGEPVCKYLLDSGKAGALERYAGHDAFQDCLRELPAIVETYPTIGKQVEKASRSGFRGRGADHMAGMRESRALAAMPS